MVIFEITDKKEIWQPVISNFKYDFYHTWNYHDSCLLPEKDSEKLLFYAKDPQTNQIEFAFPLIKRVIDYNYFDLISVYGYPGPLANERAKLEFYLDEFYHFLNKCGCISLFSRTNSFCFDEIPKRSEFIKLGKTVFINLQDSEENQLKEYRSNHKRDIKKLLKNGAKTVITKNGVDQFIGIYNQTMENRRASSQYFFEKNYYNELIGSDEFDAFFVFVELDGKKICGGLFTKCNNIVQYHLGGTLREYHKIAPSKLMFDFVRKHFSNKTVDFFNLGGGLGSREDGLFNFKRGFSKDTHDFYVMKKVINQTQYNRMCENRAKSFGMTLKELKQQADNFFPLYRFDLTPAV